MGAARVVASKMAAPKLEYGWYVYGYVRYTTPVVAGSGGVTHHKPWQTSIADSREDASQHEDFKQQLINRWIADTKEAKGCVNVHGCVTLSVPCGLVPVMETPDYDALFSALPGNPTEFIVIGERVEWDTRGLNAKTYRTTVTAPHRYSPQTDKFILLVAAKLECDAAKLTVGGVAACSAE